MEISTRILNKLKPTNIALIVLILMVIGCSTKPFVVSKEKINLSKANEIFIVNHGWHTGIVVNSKLIKSILPDLKNRFSNDTYIEFGWGDKGFYQSKEITSSLTIQAILWPTESVVHAVGFDKHPKIRFSQSDVRPICLNPHQYSKLISFVESSFLKNKYGKIIPSRKGIYGNSQFYQAEGDYYLMNTCNKWTAKALKSADLPISTTFKLTAGSIIGFLDEYEETSNYSACH